MMPDRDTHSSRLSAWLLGFGTGCGLLYLLDPRRGTRRRAFLRDKMVHGNRVAHRAAEKTWRDLQHRAAGVVAEVRSKLQPEHCTDDVLIQRVRAHLGRACSHPNSIEVDASDGHVVLSGPILESEADRLRDEVRAVRGVREVEDRLERHKTSDAVPGLQGGRTRGQPSDLLQSRWAPATRFVAGIGGIVFLVRGLRRGGVIGTGEAVVAAGLLARAATNFELRQLLGIGETRGAVCLQKTMNVHAPVEQVFNLLAHPEYFPRFMSRVMEVRQTGGGRYEWKVAGPAGISIGWQSEITELVPNKILAWRSVPGSAVRNAGILRFDPNPDNGTRLHIRMSYNPPGGALGHVFASIFDADPKAALDEDLGRMKSLLELGKTRAHGERVTREQVGA